MKATTYLQKQIKNMRSLQDSVLNSLPDELIAWSPPGTLSSIGIIWLHMIASEDYFITQLTDHSTLWKTQGWQKTFDLEKYPNMGDDWSTVPQAAITTNKLESYMKAVRAQTDTYLEAMTDDVFDEKIQFFTENDAKADLLTLLITHSMHHTGEISAVKGLQGQKGLPF